MLKKRASACHTLGSFRSTATGTSNTHDSRSGSQGATPHCINPARVFGVAIVQDPKRQIVSVPSGLGLPCNLRCFCRVLALNDRHVAEGRWHWLAFPVEILPRLGDGGRGLFLNFKK